VRVDTGGLSVADAATQILHAVGDWPGVT
jgi:hypothetical protein